MFAICLDVTNRDRVITKFASEEVYAPKKNTYLHVLLHKEHSCEFSNSRANISDRTYQGYAFSLSYFDIY